MTRGFFNKDNGEEATDYTIEQGSEVEWSWQIALGGVTPTMNFQKVKNQGRLLSNISFCLVEYKMLMLVSEIFEITWVPVFVVKVE